MNICLIVLGAQREVALGMVANLPGDQRVTVGAENNKRRRSAIDRRTTRHPGYKISQQRRQRVEEIG